MPSNPGTDCDNSSASLSCSRDRIEEAIWLSPSIYSPMACTVRADSNPQLAGDGTTAPRYEDISSCGSVVGARQGTQLRAVREQVMLPVVKGKLSRLSDRGRHVRGPSKNDSNTRSPGFSVPAILQTSNAVYSYEACSASVPRVLNGIALRRRWSALCDVCQTILPLFCVVYLSCNIPRFGPSLAPRCQPLLPS